MSQPPIIPGAPPSYVPPVPVPPNPKRGFILTRTKPRVGVTFGIIGLILGAAMSGGGGGTTPTAGSPGATVTVTKDVSGAPAPAVTVTKEVIPKGPTGKAVTFDDGTWIVGEDIEAGTYKVTAAVASGCYWAILKSGTNGSDIIANDIVDGGFPKVTLKVGHDFKSSDCGTWSLV